MSIDLLREIGRVRHHVNRASEKNLPATLTIEEWIDRIYQFDGLCAYCLEAPFDNLDHLIPMIEQGGTTRENCYPTCDQCNSKKGSRSIVDPELHLSEEEQLTQVRFVLANTIRIPLSEKRKPIRTISSQEDDKWLSIRGLPEEVLKEMRELAEEHTRSLNGEVLVALREYIKQQRQGLNTIEIRRISGKETPLR